MMMMNECSDVRGLAWCIKSQGFGSVECSRRPNYYEVVITTEYGVFSVEGRTPEEVLKDAEAQNAAFELTEDDIMAMESDLEYEEATANADIAARILAGTRYWYEGRVLEESEAC